ncbi:MAG: hypothetical protein K5765_06745 [Clostridia bacterium]|nr:hypothetical protein [Clostridia bacterium]
MSKELSPLEACRIIKEHDFPVMIAILPPIPATMNGKTEKDLWNIIETALKRLEKIDNQDNITGIIEEVPIGEISKKLKALDIIKAHPEQLLDIIETDNYNEYLDLDYAPSQYITEQEYDLLKEVLL